MLGIGLAIAGCGPKRTYAQGCGAIPKGWITPRQGRGDMSLLSVTSVKNDGSIWWNGEKVSEAEFLTRLKASTKLAPMPVTQIKFAPGVDCDTVARLRQKMVATLDCQYRMCAEGSGKWWRISDMIWPGVKNEPYDPSPGSPPGND